MHSEPIFKDSLLNRNVCHITIAPIHPVNGAEATQADDDGQANVRGAIPFVSMLSSTPRTFFDVWTEYQYGIGRCKPAKDFIAAERGKVKDNYHWRKVVWDTIAALVHAGHTSVVAID